MPEPLNIVLMMADQWRWDTIFEPGHFCQTPRLRQFASQGVAFPHAYTSCPLCTPARASLFTGLWPHQAHMMDNVDRLFLYPHAKLHQFHRTYLERLQDAGYAVSYAGKWHLGWGTLTERGITNVRESDGELQSVSKASPVLDGDARGPYYGSYSAGVGRDQRIVEAGMEQIEHMAHNGSPFCAIISTAGPHFPHNVPRRFADMYADLPASFQPDNFCAPFTEQGKPKAQARPYWPCQNTLPLSQDDWRKTCQHYWAFCTHLDEQFGRTLDKLDALGIAEKTVVAFVTDHGEMLGAHGCFDKGPYFYDEIVHIPLIVRDPRRRIARNRDGFVGLRDLFPTLLSLADVDDVLCDEERARSYWLTNNDHAFYTYDAYQGREFKLRGIHAGRYKYNWSPHDVCELYDLQEDPGERTNLACQPSHAAIQADLHSQVTAWMEAEGDYLLCSRHVLPCGAYADGRSADEMHDPRWPQDDWEWFQKGWR